MYTFWKKYVALCAQKGVSPTKASVDMGFSRATASGWKKGKKPNDVTLQIVADYFGVPVSYFNDGDKPKLDLQLFAEDKDTTQEKILIEIYRSLDEIDKAKLLVYASELSKL